MFGNNASARSNGTKSLAGGLLITIIQTLLTRRVAGRAAGVAARGGAGIPGLLIWMAASYFLNKYLNRNNTPNAGPRNAPQGRSLAAR